MQIKKDTKVRVQYRPELGTGAVLQVAEVPGGEYNVDVVFGVGSSLLLTIMNSGHRTRVKSRLET